MLGNLLKRRSISYQDVWGSGGDWEPLGGLTSVEKALGVSAVFACVDLVASRIQAMDLHQYRRAQGEPDRMDLSPVLASPSALYEPDEWIYQAAASLLLYGRLVGYVVAAGRDGWPRTVEWLNPDKVLVQEGRWTYEGRPVDRSELIVRRYAPMIPGDEMGVSPLKKLHVDIQQAVKAKLYELDFFASGGLPIATLTFDGDIGPGAAEDAARKYDETRRSRGRKPLVIGKAWKLESLRGFTPSESGTGGLEERINTKVANVFHVPPEWVGGKAGGSLTYSSPAMASRQLIEQALKPVYRSLERTFTRHLLPAPQFVAFDPESIVGMDPTTAAQLSERLIRSGIATPAERRPVHGLPPRADATGDQLLWPPYSTSAPRA